MVQITKLIDMRNRTLPVYTLASRGEVTRVKFKMDPNLKIQFEARASHMPNVIETLMRNTSEYQQCYNFFRIFVRVQ